MIIKGFAIYERKALFSAGVSLKKSAPENG